MARKMKTMDGNNAAAHVSYAFTEVAAIYPITPSSVMAEVTDVMATKGTKNLFGQPVQICEMQSEGGAVGAVHGSLSAGALTTTYTASQGLLLMIPNMYKIAGELIPNVIHVSARCVSSHALNIFGDHSDVYACRQTGYAMLCSANVQEVMDLGAVAHLSTIKGRVPFLHFFDGFRTSHEIQKIEVWDYKDLGELLDWDAVNAFRRNALNPEHPVLRGSAENPDVFFQHREACNKYYDDIVGVTEDYMNKVNAKLGTSYKLFNYYGAPDAEKVIIAMGSVCDTIEETVDYLNANGAKVGVVKVHLYRPFSAKHLIAAIPETVKCISVLDRTKEPGSLGEPLFLDVSTALREGKFASVPVYGGRYGLGSKEATPADIIACFKNMDAAEPKKRFTLAVIDDVTNLSLPREAIVNTTPEGTTNCKFWGLGSDGTVGANKNSIKIIGDNTDMYAQGYFSYDSKKSGGITVSHLRFGKTPIKSTYLINKANFVACHQPSYVNKYPMVQDLVPGGTFLLNCSWSGEDLDKNLPGSMKKYIAENDIQFYTIDATHIGLELGLGSRINTILQSAFFGLSKIIPADKAVELMKDAATRSYSKKGQDIVDLNHRAIERGIGSVTKVDVPAYWKDSEIETKDNSVECDRADLKKYVENVLAPQVAQQGDTIPVSAFFDTADGTLPQGSAAFEKRGIAVKVPTWIPENCIQCGRCAYVCPHAVIRPYGLTDDDVAAASEGTKTLNMIGMPGYKFTLGISVMDCTGCGSCANVCPGNKNGKALEMNELATQTAQQPIYDYLYKLPEKEEILEKFKDSTVKGSQFRTPLLEFSGACAGCGETPYAKLVTQLFGDRAYIANATGCSSIWGGSAPSTPYTVNQKGKGPAWANSLFEDNAEFGLGMLLAQEAITKRLAEKVNIIAENCKDEKIVELCKAWLDTVEDSAANQAPAAALLEALKGIDEPCETCAPAIKEIIADGDFLAQKTHWIFGGDGWAYDIGYGGLDHVLASHKNVNIMVFDTEVYSNTGGQASKSTPTGAIAQFAAAGKEVKKKDLAAIAMSYGYVYVAQVAMGADYNQCLKAIKEAEAYNGPSIVIAYAPCINHGIKAGMGKAMDEEAKAVKAGYWYNFRFNPDAKKEGKNPLTVDSKEPTEDYIEFIKGENRYANLMRQFPERAQRLYDEAAAMAGEKYEYYKKLVKLYEPDAE